MTETVRFDFTIDDLVDVGQRNIARSSVVRGMRRTATLSAGILVALVLFLVVPLALPLRSGVAAVGGLAAAASYPSMRRRLVRDKLRSYWRERLGREGPFTCEVELTPEGITTRQLDVTNSTPWSAIESATETPDGVEIRRRQTGLLVVRERAFASAEAKRAFVERIRASLLP